MWVSSHVWAAVLAELELRRAEAQKQQERIDRLTEAVARKADVPLYMPQSPEVAHLEKAVGWFDTEPAKPLSTGGPKK